MLVKKILRNLLNNIYKLIQVEKGTDALQKSINIIFYTKRN